MDGRIRPHPADQPAEGCRSHVDVGCFANAWTAVIGGGGIKGGSVVGKTSPDGMTVVDRPANAPDILATVCRAIGIDHTKQNMSNVNRPIRIVDKVCNPITEVLA